MLAMGVDERCRRLMRRHRLAADASASSVLDAVHGVLVLHATDPATVYLSVLARCPAAIVDDVTTAMYEDRSLVKMIAMRRTMFVAPRELVPAVHSGAGRAIADRLRRQLVQRLSTLPTEPEVEGDVAAWLTDVESNITSRVLTLMGADGRIVRGRPGGTWISRQHRWLAARELWPDGMPELPVDEARAELVRRWLAVFGPVTVADVQWWTGWTLGVTRKTLAALDVVEVDLDDSPGIVLAGDAEPEPAVEPSAALLPALDPTPMGWQQRDWFLGAHRERLFDRNGNIGPTVWWDGRVVGGWAVRAGGEVVWRMLEDVGAEVESAVEGVAARLQKRIDGVVVVPSFRTPLERELSA